MTKKTTLWLFVCFLFLLEHNVLAVPAVPWMGERIQPDGSKITVYLRGDEKVHWMESLDGYTLMYDTQKFIVYAELDADKNMIPSKSIYSELSVPPSGATKGIRYSPSQVSTLEQIWKITQESINTNLSQLRSAEDEEQTIHTVCALVNFSDKSLVKTKGEFEALMNQVGYTVGGAKGSVYDYFHENSYNKLKLEVTVAGPYTLSKEWSYYGANNPATGSDYTNRVQEFAREAANLTFTDSSIDPALYDNDGDGYIDVFHIIFAGHGEEVSGSDPNNIWSHKYGFSALTFGSTKIDTYSCSPELRGNSGSNITYIGVICHEMNHVFGSPDYYDTDGNGSGGNYIGSGNWDLMANGSWNDGGRQPAHINMFQKILSGWVTPVELSPNELVTAMPPSATNPIAYTFKANPNGEMYVLENKQQMGFDGSVPGHGLLIWHVHQSALGGKGSNAAHPQQMYPVCASSATAIPGSAPSSYGSINSPGCPFPGASGKTSFTDISTPQAFSWANLSGISKPIINITENADKTVSFGYILDLVDDPVTNLQYSVNSGNVVTLTWEAPDNTEVQGYKIYRDDNLIYAINNPALLQYTQMNVVNGAYTYSVTAKYALIESVKESVSVTVSEGSDAACFPINNLAATTTANSVNLTWDAPFTSGWVGISGSWYTAYTFTLGAEWDSFQGTLWMPDDLAGMDGYSITKVKFVPFESGAGVTYAIAIYQVPSGGNPVLVYSQPVSSLSYGTAYNEIELTTPVPVDAAKGLIIGTQIHTMGGYYISVDNGDPYPGRNLFYDVDGWYTFEMLNIPAGRNYCLGAYLDSNTAGPVMSYANKNASEGEPVFLKKVNNIPLANDSPFDTSFLKKENSSKKLFASQAVTPDTGLKKAPPQILKYIIYRDGVYIGESNTPDYQDTGLMPGESYSYCVSVVYDNFCTSESVCLEVTPVNPYQPVQNLKAIAGFTDVALTWDKPTNANPDSYKVFRDGAELAEVTETSYTDNTVNPQNTYNYCVVAVYNEYDDGAPGTSVYSTGFETGQTAGIVAIDANGDSKTWTIYTGASYAHSGSNFALNYSWDDTAITPNDWLVLPAITLPAGSSAMDYYIAALDATYSAEHYGVYVSTTYNGGTNTSSFTLLYEETLTSASAYSKGYTKHTIDLSAYAGQSVRLAFRHFNCYDQYALMLDDISVYQINAVLTGTNLSGQVCLDVTTLSESANFVWQGTDDADWDNPGNWLDGEVPTSSGIVYIPGPDDVDTFPDLYDLGDPVQVAETHFAPGAQIGRQSKLKTEKAFIQYDLKVRERWQMLSIPLGQVFPGDFVFGGYPLTWVRTFTANNSGSGVTKGAWVTARNNNREAFTWGDGFVIRLNPDGGVQDNPNNGLKLLKSILEVPYFYTLPERSNTVPDFGYINEVNMAQGYNSETGESTFFNFEYDEAAKMYIRIPTDRYTATRTEEKAYQLADGTLSKEGLTFSDGFCLIGNPFMAVLDFDALSSANSTVIKRVYYVWTINGYQAYSPEGTAGVIYYGTDEANNFDPINFTDASNSIAPLQGFIIESINSISESGASDPFNLVFNENMTSVNEVDVALRSVNNGNKLGLVASNQVAGVRTFIAKREGGQDEFGNSDARKIMNEISDVPEIYTLKPYKGKLIAAAINIINNDELLIPIGLATNYAGNITFTFSGMDSYDAHLSLIDAETNRTIDLTGLTSHDYSFSYTPKIVNGAVVSCEDRFLIRISKTATGLKEAITEKVNVFESNGSIRIISGASNPIKEVAVYNLQGALIYKATSVNAISHTINLNRSAGVYIIKVISEKDIDNIKIVTGNS